MFHRFWFLWCTLCSSVSRSHQSLFWPGSIEVLFVPGQKGLWDVPIHTIQMPIRTCFFLFWFCSLGKGLVGKMLFWSMGFLGGLQYLEWPVGKWSPCGRQVWACCLFSLRVSVMRGCVSEKRQLTAHTGYICTLLLRCYMVTLFPRSPVNGAGLVSKCPQWCSCAPLLLCYKETGWDCRLLWHCSVCCRNQSNRVL